MIREEMKSGNVSELYGNKGNGLKYGPGTQQREERTELGTRFGNLEVNQTRRVQGGGQPIARLQAGSTSRGP